MMTTIDEALATAAWWKFPLDRARIIFSGLYVADPRLYYRDIGLATGVSGPRIRQNEERILRILRHPRNRIIAANIDNERLMLAIFGADWQRYREATIEGRDNAKNT